MKVFSSLLLSIFLSVSLMAQQRISTQALAHLSKTYEQLGLQASDIENVIIDHAYTDKNGNSFIYLKQSQNGVPVHNAIMTIAISKQGKVMTTANRFVPNLESKIVSDEINISEIDAIQSVAEYFKNKTSVTLVRRDRNLGISYFEAQDLASNEIPVTLKYTADSEGKMHKSYDISIDMKGNSDWWSIRIDTKNGNIISKNNRTVYCNHGYHSSDSKSGHRCQSDLNEKPSHRQSTILGDGASYRVYPLPAENPNETNQVLLVDPSDPIASPLGWHDTDGMEGPEYTITRGNNVHAYLDTADMNTSLGFEPEGGEALVFDFVHDANQDPINSADAAQVNLFYANNFIHDFSYHLGFDEAAGNFQAMNYSQEGLGNDPVQAEALDGQRNNDGTIVYNNANFTPTIEGSSPRMQMYLWNNPRESTFASILAPEQIAADLPTGNPNWGFPIDANTQPVTGKAVLIDDGTQFGNLGCDPAINADEINGNIAIIERGDCDFGTKALNAQLAGAIGVIVCNVGGVNGNTGDELLDMAPGPDGDEVIIPVRAFRASDCNKIRASISAGIDVEISLKFTEFDEPNFIDGSYDNGVIVHEYAHGISHRLIGGPSNIDCLPLYYDDIDLTPDRGEQMGEGYSDFVALIASIKAGDNGTDEKSVGEYLDPLSVGGIRRFPYSTDMDICPLTYNDIAVGTAQPVSDSNPTGVDDYSPHAVGELMAAIGWDLLWTLVDTYGLDPTWTDSNSGNYIAARLVFDGMKLQPCEPGYVDVRDGILYADSLNNNGANTCAIWDVFARRGLGMEADQGSPSDHRDGTEDFTAMATCIEKLKVTREIPELIQPGAIVTVEIEAINHIPGNPIEAIITEKLETGLSYVNGSSPYPVTVDGNILTFDIGTLAYDEPLSFAYELSVSTDIKSSSIYIEELENNGENFEFVDYRNEMNSFVDIEGRNETRGLGASAPSSVVDLAIITPTYEVPNEVDALPALRFWHKYDLQESFDAVFISISTDGGNNWNYATDFIKNGYNSDIQYGTFAIPSLRGFSGSTNGNFIDSYVDLSAYKGQDIKVRFRLGTDANTTVDADFPGWIVDDIELMDLKQYTVETCIGTLANQELECNPQTTIIIDTNLDTTNTNDADNDIYNMTVYPNPANTKLYLDISSPISEKVQITLTNIEGKLIRTSTAQLSNNVKTIGFNLVGIDSGMYVIQVQSQNGISTRKFVKK